MVYNRKEEVIKMVKVYSAKQNKALDEATRMAQSISGFELMVRAAKACTSVLIEKQLLTKQQHILIVCGVNNNGGDGLMIGYELFLKGYDISIVLVNQPVRFSDEVKLAMDKLKKHNIPVELLDTINLQTLNTIKSFDVIIDALLGIGLNRECDAFYCGLIEAINQSFATIISIDIPSGLHATSGFALPVSIKATYTLVIGALNVGHVLFDGWDVCGMKHVVDIGLVDAWFSSCTLHTNDTLSLEVPKRKHNTHKYDYGHVLVVGGSLSMNGSVALSSMASLKSGAGLVSLAIHNSNLLYQRHLAYEIMTPIYHDESSFHEILPKKTSIVYGMGLSKNNQPDYVLKHLLLSEASLVIDADGLTHFKHVLKKPHSNKALILTPHLEELRRLMDLTHDQIKQDPIHYVETLAKQTQAIVLCKGPSTILSDGTQTEILKIGNPGLATAGSGDVLAGIIGTFIGQHHDAFNGVKQALILFDRAAYLAYKEVGEHGLIASDIIKYLPQAFL